MSEQIPREVLERLREVTRRKMYYQSLAVDVGLLLAEHAALRAEVERLRIRLTEECDLHFVTRRSLQKAEAALNAKNTLTCVYCGHAYPPDSPTHGASMLTEHIKVCEKHPLRAAEAEVERLHSSRADVYSLLTEYFGSNLRRDQQTLHYRLSSILTVADMRTERAEAALRPFAALDISGDVGTEAWDAMIRDARAALHVPIPADREPRNFCSDCNFPIVEHECSGCGRRDEPVPAEQPECPGPHCPMCAGVVCNLCGAGMRNNALHCEHDSVERHEMPEIIDLTEALKANLPKRAPKAGKP